MHDEDNPSITCPYCGSTDQEYIFVGDWICGDCGERWNERQRGEGMTDDLIRCPVCGSSDVDGLPMDEGVEMPNPDDEDRPLVGYAVVAFTCQACGHRWVDGDSQPSHSHGES